MKTKSYIATFVGELTKCRTLYSLRVTFLLSGVLVMLVSGFVVLQASRFQSLGRGADLGGMQIYDWPIVVLHYGQIIPIVASALVLGQDGSVGARRRALLVTPNRLVLYISKLLIVIVTSTILAVVCTLGAVAPLLFIQTDGTQHFDAMRILWVIVYWPLIGIIGGSLVAATRSVAIGVVPVLVWVFGFSDLIAARIPEFDITIDQIFKALYLLGATPSIAQMILAAVQVAIAAVFGALVLIRKDAG